MANPARDETFIVEGSAASRVYRILHVIPDDCFRQGAVYDCFYGALSGEASFTDSHGENHAVPAPKPEIVEGKENRIAQQYAAVRRFSCPK